MSEDPDPAPLSDSSLVPICAIGASAGGVTALRKFFSLVRTDLNLAYVVVVHLSPDHPSALSEILGSCTRMSVNQVEDGPSLEPNRVYVIPPDRELVITGNAIAARPFTQPRGQRAPIDMLFRSIAAARGDGCALIMSGSGADGSLGVRAIKEAGGVVLVQEPGDAEYPMMPQNAIATGAADFIGPIGELVERLTQIANSKDSIRSLSVDGEGNEVRRILHFMRARTGHDFSNYKRATVSRRIVRRLQVTRRETLEAYAAYVRDTPEEAKELFGDLLISVTMFFRDPRNFQVLAQQVIPRIFEDMDQADGIRAWTVGCATGEEAYSVAILLLEEAANRKVSVPIQVFATDLDEGALATAREGRYPRSIEADVAEERLRRWFVADGSHYRVRQELRDVVLFALHSALKDPPFLRLDLVTCRNLFIYLDRPLQQQLSKVFHYALRPGRFLFLGSAETLDSAVELFSPLDREARVYQARAQQPRILPRAANEELQSINEEYRSTVEELETSKEELQSINEELQTVNAELKSKLESISSAHNDLQNLTTATEIGTLFLDPQLRIRMFTPPVAELFNICEADVGRPITNFTHQMRYQDIEQDSRRVLRHLAPFETVIESTSGKEFMMRIRPYRTLEDRIDGLVITFVDVSARLKAERQLRQSEARYRRLFNSIDEAFCILEIVFDEQQRPCDIKYVEVNAAFERQTGLQRVEGKSIRSLVPGLEAYWYEIFGRVASTGQPERFEGHAASLGRHFEGYAFALAEEGRIGTLFMDISSRKQSEAHLKLMVDELNHRVKNTLAVVQAMAQQTFKEDVVAADAKRAFLGRLTSLAIAHNLLTRSHWEKTSLAEVLRAVVAGCRSNPEQFVIDGPAVVLSSAQAVSLSMAIHELCVNAIKYGALSQPQGRVEVSWLLSGDEAQPHVRLTWRERGGPPVAPPARHGFGLMMIEKALAYELGGAAGVDFRPEGIVCTIGAVLVSQLQPQS